MIFFWIFFKLSGDGILRGGLGGFGGFGGFGEFGVGELVGLFDVVGGDIIFFFGFNFGVICFGDVLEKWIYFFSVLIVIDLGDNIGLKMLFKLLIDGSFLILIFVVDWLFFVVKVGDFKF